MRIVIIGAGLAGCIAYGATSSLDPRIYESKPGNRAGLFGHHAVMRMRDPYIARYLGCSVEKIDVYKSVYYGFSLHDKCDLDMLNSYSKKVYGSLGVRSIMNLGVSERYLMSKIKSPTNIRHLHTLVGVSDGSIKFRVDCDSVPSVEKNVDYDVCISTLPLPVMLSCCGLKCPDIFTSRPINVYTYKIGIESSVHQTIYFPESITNVYRATLEFNKLIVESVGRIHHSDLENVRIAFGISDISIEDVSINVQEYGKISCSDDNLRRALIHELSEKFNIYSFGRYATWRPLRADQLSDDIDKINSLIGVSQERRRYESRLMEV